MLRPPFVVTQLTQVNTKIPANSDLATQMYVLTPSPRARPATVSSVRRERTGTPRGATSFSNLRATALPSSILSDAGYTPSRGTKRRTGRHGWDADHSMETQDTRREVPDLQNRLGSGAPDFTSALEQAR